jgi:glycosyltransferase involved in cell wall biosynthesis
LNIRHDLKSSNIKIKYLARWNESASIGVINKIKNTTSALSSNGYQAEHDIVHKDGILGHLLLPLKIIQCRADLLIVRATAFSMLLCSLPLLIQRLKGKKIVIDVPTPLVSVLEEINGSSKSKLKKFVLRTLIKINYPLALYVAHRVIQYSEESPRFLLGIKRKTFMGANGVDVSSIKLRNKKNIQPGSLTLIGVAALEKWHGYDRVIQGISNYYKNINSKQKIDVNFIIVGSGSIEQNLKTMAQDLEVAQYIHFKGTLSGQALTDIFDQADVAVASLGVHRKGLRIASDLKSREYLSRGFPILVSAEDPDIPHTLEFIYSSPADDSAIDIENLLEWHKSYISTSNEPETLRAFALQHLDYKSKSMMYTKALTNN